MKRKNLILAISIGGLVGVGLASLIAYAKFSIHGKISPGTHVADIDISYLKISEARELLQKKVNKYFDIPIKISFQGKTENFKPQDLGLNILVKETVDEIRTTDASKMNLLDLFEFSNASDKNLKFVTVIDHSKLKTTLESYYKFSELAPKSATFYFDESSKLAIMDGQSGIVVDYDVLANEFKDSARNLNLQSFEIETQQKEPTVSKQDLIAMEGQMKEALNHEFALIDPVYSDDWYVKLTDHLDWVKFVEKQKIKIPYFGETILDTPSEAFSGKNYITIEIDEKKLNQYVDAEISKWLDRPAEPVKIYKNAEGKVMVEGKGSDGLKIQREQLKKSIELAVANKIKNVPIPVTKIKPDIDIAKDLQDIGIKERIAIGHSSYYNSPPNRVHNIKTGANKFNGVIIAPGETFSFNETLGPVEAYTGYKKELVIKQEGTLPEYGGGICQVSTTVFRTAMLAGLPIAERNEHSYAVSYYSQVMGHGMDATIYLGGADLKFVNDSGNHLLIQTYVESDYELYIVLYGTPDGRKVELEGPYLSNYHNPGPTVYVETDDLVVGETKQVEKAHTGFNALWYRHLTDKDGNTTKESIETHYRAIPAKIWVGTKTENPEISETP